MRVIVRFHPDCRADLAAWLARLPGAPDDRRALLSVVVEELKAALLRTAGRPSSARLVPTPPPPSYLWPFSDGCVVRYRATDTRTFWRRTRHLEVVNLLADWPS